METADDHKVEKKDTDREEDATRTASDKGENRSKKVIHVQGLDRAMEQKK